MLSFDNTRLCRLYEVRVRKILVKYLLGLSGLLLKVASLTFASMAGLVLSSTINYLSSAA
jgi:hypothetical protein